MRLRIAPTAFFQNFFKIHQNIFRDKFPSFFKSAVKINRSGQSFKTVRDNVQFGLLCPLSLTAAHANQRRVAQFVARIANAFCPHQRRAPRGQNPLRHREMFKQKLRADKFQNSVSQKFKPLIVRFRGFFMLIHITSVRQSRDNQARVREFKSQIFFCPALIRCKINAFNFRYHR